MVNTKNPQIKHFPCSKYMMIYRPDLYITAQKKTTKKVTNS